MSLLATENLSIGYPERSRPPKVVAKSLTLTLEAGSFTGLIGANGSGKSTLLRTLAGMQTPLGGSVLLDGESIHALSASARARSVAVVLTERVMPGLLTGWALVALGRHPYTGFWGTLQTQDEQAIRQAVSLVNAEPLADKPLAELSDGERQRLLIARALAQEPRLLILDEPTAFLDAPSRAALMTMLRDVARATGCAVIISTHDLDMVQRTADMLWVMDGKGALHSGAPEDLGFNGALEAAFAGHGAYYDPQTGGFSPIKTHQQTVTVIGSGLSRSWAERAVERAGLWLNDSPGHAYPRVVCLSEQHPGWILETAPNTAQAIDSLGVLVSTLRTAYMPNSA
jgi:iron complex transport system ATP-binding protein